MTSDSLTFEQQLQRPRQDPAPCVRREVKHLLGRVTGLEAVKAGGQPGSWEPGVFPCSNVAWAAPEKRLWGQDEGAFAEVQAGGDHWPSDAIGRTQGGMAIGPLVFRAALSLDLGGTKVVIEPLFS